MINCNHPVTQRTSFIKEVSTIDINMHVHAAMRRSVVFLRYPRYRSVKSVRIEKWKKSTVPLVASFIFLPERSGGWTRTSTATARCLLLHTAPFIDYLTYLAAALTMPIYQHILTHALLSVLNIARMDKIRPENKEGRREKAVLFLHVFRVCARAGLIRHLRLVISEPDQQRY